MERFAPLAVLFATLAGCGSNTEEAAVAADPAPLGSEWNAVSDPTTGAITFAEPRSRGAVLLTNGTSPTAAARAFLDANTSRFRVIAKDFVDEAEGVDDLGLRFASLTYARSDIGSSPYRLSFHFDLDGRLAFVAGRYPTSVEVPALPPDSQRPPSQIDGSGKGIRGDVKRFPVSISARPGMYELRRAGSATTTELTCKAVSADGNSYDVVTSPNLDAWDEAGDDHGAAVDAYVHAIEVLSFYRQTLGRNSWDDKDSPVSVTVHADVGGAVSASGHITIGKPEPARASPNVSYAISLDVIAHEFQHSVIEATLRLADGTDFDGSNAGPLNESIADMFGAMVEHAVRPGDHNFTIGEDAAAPGYPPTRDLAHPSRCLDICLEADCTHRACPDHFSKLDPLADDHRQTGISSNAWYLMTMGGENDTSHVRVDGGIGWDASLRLWYALVVSRAIAPSARFEDVALATVALQRHATGNARDVAAVACAWVAVGVLTSERVASFWNVRCGG